MQAESSPGRAKRQSAHNNLASARRVCGGIRQVDHAMGLMRSVNREGRIVQDVNLEPGNDHILIGDHRLDGQAKAVGWNWRHIIAANRGVTVTAG